MSRGIALGRGQRAPRVPSGLAVVPLIEALAARWDRLLVVGDTAEVARAVASGAARAVAFAGARELCRLFAVDPAATAGLARLDGGTPYPCDLGKVRVGDGEFTFLGTVAAGAGADGGWRFPWWGRGAPVSVDTGRGPRTEVGRSITVSNLQHWGRWTVSPGSAANDGLVEALIYRGSPAMLWRLRRGLRRGIPEASGASRRLRGPEALVMIPDRWRVTADGRRVGRGPFSVTVEAAAATLLI